MVSHTLFKCVLCLVSSRLAKLAKVAEIEYNRSVLVLSAHPCSKSKASY